MEVLGQERIHVKFVWGIEMISTKSYMLHPELENKDIPVNDLLTKGIKEVIEKGYQEKCDKL
jgi:hypothetical protein